MVPKSEFSGGKRRGDKGEVKRGKVVKEGTVLQGERGGRRREKVPQKMFQADAGKVLQNLSEKRLIRFKF